MEPYARYLPSRTFTYMLGSLIFAGLLIWGASLLSKEPKKSELVAVGGTNEASQGLTKLIQERVDAQKNVQAPAGDWEKEFAAVTSKPLNPKTDLASSTLTDLLARSLVTRLSNAQSSGAGVALDAAEQQKIIAETLGKINLSPSNYAARDIIVGSDDGAAALRVYGNTLGKLIRDNSDTNTNEAVVLSQALAQNNPALLSGLEPIATSYRNLLFASRHLPVPPSAVEAHLALVNSLSSMVDSVEAMQVSFKDPVRTVLYVNNYQRDALALYDAFSKLAALFSKKGTIFSEDELGSVIISLGSK